MITKLKQKLSYYYFKIPSRVELVHKGEHFFHMTYLGAVSYEAHGLYAHAAQILLAVTITGVLVGKHEK